MRRGARIDEIGEVALGVDVGDPVVDVEALRAGAAVVQDALGELRRRARAGADVLPQEGAALGEVVRVRGGNGVSDDYGL